MPSEGKTQTEEGRGEEEEEEEEVIERKIEEKQDGVGTGPRGGGWGGHEGLAGRR